MERITRSRYQQMIGRAGRTGFDTQGESILIAKSSDVPFVVNNVLLGPVDRVKSQLDKEGLEQLILGLVYLDLSAKHLEALTNIIRRSTLLGLQVPITRP